MVGAIAKTYWAEKAGVDASKVKVVSVMPCTAKKWEIGRDETMNSSGYNLKNSPGSINSSGRYLPKNIQVL
jgi:hypothetical protein